MMTIIVFWALVLVSLKLLVAIIIDAFRPLPKPTGKREPRESMFLCPTKAALTAMKNSRGIEDLPTWPTPPAPAGFTVSIDLWGLDLEAANRLVELRKWRMKRVGIRQFGKYRTLGSKVVRAKLALAKSFGMPLQRVLDEDLWKHPDCLRWNGLNLKLVLGTQLESARRDKATNLNFGLIRKSDFYHENEAPTPYYYIWMLPSYDFTEWEVIGVLSYAEVDCYLSSRYTRLDVRNTTKLIGISEYDLGGRRNWAHPLDWYRKVTSTKASK